MPQVVIFSLLGMSLLTPVWGMNPTLVLVLLAWGLLLVKLTSVSSHTLLLLLIMEFFMLTFLLLLMVAQTGLFSSSNFILTFFTLAVCEAALGLGLLIALSRKFGSQLLSMFLAFKLKKLSAFKAKITCVKHNLVYLLHLISN